MPRFYRGATLTQIKEARRLGDPRKRDLAPTVLDFGPFRVKLARHDGVVVNAQPEYEDVVAAATALGQPVKAVLADAVAAIRMWS